MPVAAIVPPNASAELGQHPIGTGPWKFVSWSHDDAIVLAANAEYWGTRPRSDTLGYG
jgi:ABC-type transport system substrate-binding protein